MAVQDGGPGLPPHLPVETLFEPFTRGTAESTVSGIGLGLALVRSIVEAHGGRIEAAAARPGPGTVFTLRFPVPEQPLLD